MPTATASSAALPCGPAVHPLEPLLATVEQRLGALADAMRQRDIPDIALQADALHKALAHAVDAFVRAAHHGGVPPPMRLRLSSASGQLARHREALSRATASLDRAMDVLMPGVAPAGQIYLANGLAQPLQRGGNLSA